MTSIFPDGYGDGTGVSAGHTDVLDRISATFDDVYAQIGQLNDKFSDPDNPDVPTEIDNPWIFKNGLVSRKVISNDLAALLLGKSTTPPAGYDTKDDVACGRNLYVAGNISSLYAYLGNVALSGVHGIYGYTGVASLGKIFFDYWNASNCMSIGLGYSSMLLKIYNVNDAAPAGGTPPNALIPLQTNPTIAFQSSNNTILGVNQLGYISHTKTNFELATSTGGVTISQRVSRANGGFTVSAIGTIGKNFTIGANTYTWAAARGAVGSFTVAIGTTIPTAITNMVTAINADDTQGVEALLTFRDTAYQILLRADATGPSGNLIPISAGTSTNLIASGATLANGQSASSGVVLYGDHIASPGGITTKYAVDNVSTPPTASELTTAFGSPATLGAGFLGVLNEAGGGTVEYICWTDGTNWFYAEGSKAN